MKEYLPDDAFDVTVKDFVLRWKTPNSYAAAGHTCDARFMANDFLAAIQAELPELAAWSIQYYDGEPATAWSDRACLTDGVARIWVSTRGYGANAYTKAELQAYAMSDDRKHSTRATSITVSLSRPVTAIAKDMARRLLPNLDSAKVEAMAKARAEKDAIAIVTKKAESLAKRYPNLRITPDIESHRINIQTKYGAGIMLRAYTYRDSQNGVWCLTSDRGYSIGLTDIDSRYGRAFLKLCNDN